MLFQIFEAEDYISCGIFLCIDHLLILIMLNVGMYLKRGEEGVTTLEVE